MYQRSDVISFARREIEGELMFLDPKLDDISPVSRAALLVQRHSESGINEESRGEKLIHFQLGARHLHH